MAEAIFRAEIKKRKIKFVDSASAGIFVEENAALSNNSRHCLNARKIDCSKFSPKQLKHKMIENSFLVICMTSEQKALLDGFDNVYSIKEIAGFEIPDPYGGDPALYEKTAVLLEIAVNRIIERFFTAAQNE